MLSKRGCILLSYLIFLSASISVSDDGSRDVVQNQDGEDTLTTMQTEEEDNVAGDTLNVAAPDTINNDHKENRSVFNRLLKPIILTGLIGGALLLLFTQRGR